MKFCGESGKQGKCKQFLEWRGDLDSPGCLICLSGSGEHLAYFSRSKYQHCLVIQVEETVLHFIILSFGLNITPQAYTKMIYPVAWALSHLDIKIFIYLSDWLILASNCHQCEAYGGLNSNTVSPEEVLGQPHHVSSYPDSDNSLAQDGVMCMASHPSPLS